MAKFATHMGDPHGDPQTSPPHAAPRGLGASLKKTIQEIHVDQRVVSGGHKRDKLKGTNAQDSQFSADFRRFLLIFAFPGNYSISGAQIFAENRRKPQIFAETPLSHLVCPF